MHSVAMESLEDYLAGSLSPAELRALEAHLGTCEDCREEVTAMREVRLLFSSLRVEEGLAGEDAVVPSPGFYARVMQQAAEQQRRSPALAGWFGFDFAFGRRLAFACLLTLAVLGSYLVSRETDYAAGPSPEAIMAQDHSTVSPHDRDHMLVTLTSYEP
jgi:anti-sigma factor RsiW